MPRIKLLVSRISNGQSQPYGSIVDVPADEARLMVESHQAEYAVPAPVADTVSQSSPEAVPVLATLPVESPEPIPITAESPVVKSTPTHRHKFGS